MSDNGIGAMLLSEFIYVCSLLALYAPGRHAGKRGWKKLSAWLAGMYYMCGGAGIGYAMASVDLLGGVLALAAFGAINGLSVYLDRELARRAGIVEGKKGYMPGSAR